MKILFASLFFMCVFSLQAELHYTKCNVKTQELNDLNVEQLIGPCGQKNCRCKNCR